MGDLQPQVQQAPSDAAQTIEVLAKRLAKVEGQLKGLQYAFPGLAILVVALLVTQLNKPSSLDLKSVFAESFGVKNSKGQIVARLGMTSDDAPNMAFFDAQQKIRLMMLLHANGAPTMSLIDPQGGVRAVLSLNDQHDPSLALSNAEKQLRGVLSVDTGGAGHLTMYSANGGLDLAAADGRVRWTPRDGAPVDAFPVKP